MLLRLLLLAGLAAPAHEIGTTRVTVEFPADGTYSVELDTDAVALLEKLAAVTGRSGQLPEFDQMFRQRVALEFDGVSVRPAITYSSTIRLTGAVPPGAKAFTWKYGWTFATYSLAVRGGNTVWLEGGQLSAPLSLTSSPPVAWQYLALGFTHILPYGLDHVLLSK